MKPVMIHADGTDCPHQGPPQATVNDEGGPLCPAGIPVTHIRFNGQVLTIPQAGAALRDLTEGLTRSLASLTALFSDLAGAVGTAFETAFRALSAAQAAELGDDGGEPWADPFTVTYEHRPCHCLCARTHPGDKGICEASGAVTTRHYDTPLLGPVDVPLCAPCAVAQFLAEVTGHDH